eukprot:PITA_12500
MVDEMPSLHKNEAWDLVEFPAGGKPIGSKCVFKKKMNAEGKVEKYKSRVVEKEQMDVKKTFLHGDLEEEIYMKQLEGFVVKVGNDKEIIQDLKTQMSSKSDMKDLGAANYILGMEIKIKLGKEEDLLKPKYLHGTSEYGLCYQGRPRLDKFLDIHGFVDADWAGYLGDRISTGGYVFNLFGGAINWMSNKHSVVALSTTEVEYMAAAHARKEAVWLLRLCSSMGLVQRSIRIYCDSQSAILLAKNPTYHSKTKHIDVQYHFVRDMVEDKKLLLVKVDTLNNTADALTKFVSTEKFFWCREKMGFTWLDQ